MDTKVRYSPMLLYSGLPRIVWIAYVLLAGVLIGAQIFWPAPMGLANNGDFSKVLGYYDLGPRKGSADEYKSFVSEYIFSPKNRWQSGIFSSEHLFVWPAVRISRALISQDRFDVRVVGLFHLLVFLLAFAILGLVLSTLAPRRAVCLAVFALFVFTDAAYTSSLNSFYTDTATMLFVLSTIGAAIACITFTTHRLPWITCLAISGILLITSKMQHAVLGIPLCFLGIVSAIQSAKRMRAAWIVVTAAWMGTIVFMTQSSDPLYKTPPLFTTIFYKIGRSSANPVQDFQELGLGPEYLPLNGLFAYAPGSPMLDPGWRDPFLSKTGFGKVSLFYARHPRRALGFVWLDIQDFGWLNPDPGLLPYRRQNVGLGAWHSLRNYIFRWYPAHIIVVYAISVGFCVACCASNTIRARYPAWLCFSAVTAMALLALAVATLADAADTARHLFIFHVLTDAMLCFWCWFISGLIPAFQAVKLAPAPDAGAMQGVSQK